MSAAPQDGQRRLTLFSPLQFCHDLPCPTTASLVLYSSESPSCLPPMASLPFVRASLLRGICSPSSRAGAGSHQIPHGWERWSC